MTVPDPVLEAMDISTLADELIRAAMEMEELAAEIEKDRSISRGLRRRAWVTRERVCHLRQMVEQSGAIRVNKYSVQRAVIGISGWAFAVIAWVGIFVVSWRP